MSNPEIQRVLKGKSVTIKADDNCFVMVLPENGEMPLSKSTAKTRTVSHVGGKMTLPFTNPHNEADNQMTFNGNAYVDATDEAAIEQRAKLAKAKLALQ